MYIIYSGNANQYASAAVSIRKGNKTSIQYTYLGTVLDREKGIYQNRERGLFAFDPKTGEYRDVDSSFVPPEKTDHRKTEHVSVDFGDAYFVNQFLWKSGLMEAVDVLDYGNPDTMHAMLLFYMLSAMANRDAIHWYSGSIARLLYPKANLSSQRISDFLAAIGTPEKQTLFQRAYIRFVLSHYSDDRNILIDSSGLPNGIHMPYTRMNVHNGKVNNEVRLIFVVQKTTGLPLYYQAIPGNIVDIATLERVFLHLDSLGIDIESCIMDAGYNSKDNLDLFYNENHECRIGFITRVKSNDKNFCAMLEEEMDSLETKDNFVKYEGRYLFIKRKPVMVGMNENNPAWLYLGLDCARLSDEQHKLLKRAARENLSTDRVYEAMQTEGLFAILSSHAYSNEEILPAYYQRQSAEQIFDFAKNYTKLLPLRTSTEETFRGHLLLSYIASCAVKMIHIRLKTANMFFGARLECMRNQKCTIYQNRIVTDHPQKEVNETYKTFGIDCPASIPVVNGELAYKKPVANTLPEEKKKHGRRKKGTADEPQSAVGPKRKPGRPKGSKNKATEKRETEHAVTQAEPRRRGRPKGAKNKKTLERELLQEKTIKKAKKRGRPKGSRNKRPYSSQG